MNALVSVAEARAHMLRAVQPTAVECIPIATAHGRVLAEDLEVRWSVPGGDVSVMDGYAVRTADLHGRELRATVTLRVADESAAGHPSTRHLDPATAFRISTGALLPEGADTVIPQEDVQRTADQIVVDLAAAGPVRAGRWVRPAGCDLTRGSVALKAGRRLAPADLALAAAAGHATVAVHRRPKVAIVGSGDELVPLGHAPAVGEVTSCNGLLVSVLAAQWGGEVHDLGDVSDDLEALQARLMLGRSADIVVSSGGISVGDHDLVFAAWQRLGCSFGVRGVALRPGKPTSFGTLGDTAVLALPGNPASTFVAATLFLRPLLRRLLGVRGACELPTVDVTLVDEATGAGERTHMLRAKLLPDDYAQILPDQRSGNLRSFAGADALVEVPVGIERLPPGARVRAHVLDPWWTENTTSS